MGEELTIARLGLARHALAGQVAVVTGAGSGIGREAARAVAYLGAAVVVAEIDARTGEETCSLVAADGGKALFQQTDVADEASVAALAARTLGKFGRVDTLINNAILCPVASLAEMDTALWDRVIAVNLRGAYLTCKAFLPAMLQRGSAVIVNMVSTDAMPGLSAYIASKRGIAGLSQSLASEVGERGVHVIALAPGLVDTPAIRSAAGELAPRLGLSEEQFLGLCMHPAYEGLMPAADAGAATAYLVARLADEYHGEVVDGYTILERAGYIRAAAVPPATAGASAAAAPTRAEALSQAPALAAQLADMIARTEAEFNRLPVFVRPLARSGFRGKAGQSIEAWARTAEDLEARLARIGAGDLAARAELRAALRRLAALLDRLVAYTQGVPAETARFSRDPEFLRQVAETAAAREATLRALTRVLHDVVAA